MKSIPMYKVSEQLGLDRSAGRRLALRMGFKFHKKIDPDSSNQRVICLYQDEADRMVSERAKESL